VLKALLNVAGAAEATGAVLGFAMVTTSPFAKVTVCGMLEVVVPSAVVGAFVGTTVPFGRVMVLVVGAFIGTTVPFGRVINCCWPLSVLLRVFEELRAVLDARYVI